MSGDPPTPRPRSTVGPLPVVAFAFATLTAVSSVSTPGRGLAAQEPGGPHLEIPQVIERGAAGPTLLMIPCAGCGAPSWERFMEANEDRFRMVAITLPGYDGSPRPDLPLWTGDPVFQDNAIDRISELIDERGLTEITVVGQSFGTHMAVRVATARPDVVIGVVNVDGSPTNPVEWADRTDEEALALAREWVDDRSALTLQDPERYRAFNGARTQPDVEQRKLHHGMFMASDRVAMVHYWRENILRDWNPGFRALSVPYLDIEAISPRSPDPDSALAAYVEGVEEVGTPPGYRRAVYWDTSHWVHLDHPRTLGTMILDHMEGRPVRDVGPFRMGEVVERGAGDRALVLMPCLGCDWRSWEPFMERNADRYRMLAVTWPGLGSTSLPDPYGDPSGTPYFDHLMKALALLIEREDLDRPVLVGHAAAAAAAVRFATEHPDLVGGVVDVDATVVNDETHGYSAEERVAWADAEMDRVVAEHDDGQAWRELYGAPTGMAPARARAYEAMWRATPRDHLFAWWRDWLRTDAGRLLPDLTIPFLAIHALPGDIDRATEKRADLERRYRMAPLPIGGRVEFVEDSGHTIWEYRPEAFDRIVARFVLGAIGSG